VDGGVFCIGRGSAIRLEVVIFDEEDSDGEEAAGSALAMNEWIP
jgi:hypothetical protein